MSQRTDWLPNSRAAQLNMAKEWKAVLNTRKTAWGIADAAAAAMNEATRSAGSPAARPILRPSRNHRCICAETSRNHRCICVKTSRNHSIHIPPPGPIIRKSAAGVGRFGAGVGANPIEGGRQCPGQPA
jgi:hypothetical protein